MNTGLFLVGLLAAGIIVWSITQLGWMALIATLGGALWVGTSFFQGRDAGLWSFDLSHTFRQAIGTLDEE